MFVITPRRDYRTAAQREINDDLQNSTTMALLSTLSGLKWLQLETLEKEQGGYTVPTPECCRKSA